MINDFDDSEFAKTRKTIVIFSFTILLSYIGFIDFTELKFISDNDAKIETVRLMMIVGLIVLNIKFYFQLNEHKKGYLNFEALSNLEGKISGLITATEKVRKDFTKYKSDEPSYDDSLISNFNGAVQCMEELSKIHKPDGKLAIQNIDNLFENIIRTEIKSSPLSENQIKEIVKNIKRIFEADTLIIVDGPTVHSDLKHDAKKLKEAIEQMTFAAKKIPTLQNTINDFSTNIHILEKIKDEQLVKRQRDKLWIFGFDLWLPRFLSFTAFLAFIYLSNEFIADSAFKILSYLVSSQ